MTHIPLKQRKVLFARFALHQALRDDPALYVDKQTRNAIQRICSVFLSRANELAETDDSVSLSQAAEGLLRKVEPMLRDELNDVSQPQFVEALKKDLSGIYFPLTASIAPQGKTCRLAAAPADLLVHRQGACFRPFRELFDIAVAIAESYYLANVPGFGNPRVPSVSLLSAYAQGRPHRIPHPIAANGETLFEPKGAPVLASVVELTLQVNAFDWTTYRALIYVLLHECFCHAYQGMRGGPGRRGEVDNCDPFSEGWMDWLALKVLEEIDPNQWPPHLPPLPQPFSRCVTGSQDFHRARHRLWEDLKDLRDKDETEGKAMDEALAVHKGGLAAERTLEAMRRYSSGDPWSAFLRISLSLNLEPLDSEQKETIVNFCYRSFMPPEQSELEPPGYFIAMEALRQYGSTRNVTQLLLTAE